MVCIYISLNVRFINFYEWMLHSNRKFKHVSLWFIGSSLTVSPWIVHRPKGFCTFEKLPQISTLCHCCWHEDGIKWRDSWELNHWGVWNYSFRISKKDDNSLCTICCWNNLENFRNVQKWNRTKQNNNKKESFRDFQKLGVVFWDRWRDYGNLFFRSITDSSF